MRSGFPLPLVITTGTLLMILVIIGIGQKFIMSEAVKQQCIRVYPYSDSNRETCISIMTEETG